MKKLKIGIITLSLFFLSVSLYIEADLNTSKSFNGNVSSVIDGDTIDVTSGNFEERIRFLGVDTPETTSANIPEEYGFEDSLDTRKCLENWGFKAKEYVSQQLENKSVKIQTDSLSDERGDYGRILAYVRLNSSKSINHALLEKGYARVYESEFEKLEQFKNMEKDARQKNKGLWSCN